MCGITGAIQFANSKDLGFEHGGVMHKYIASRGPDHYDSKNDLLNDWRVTLGHSRLAIIDLTSDSNQPMISSDGRFVLSFNGEIYNYKEIRIELIDLGYTFRTDGDTEVLLNAWIEWGTNCMSKCIGMFAFAILDKREYNLYLVRDRFGVKPLLYGFLESGEFLFSSSIVAVALNVGSELDLEYCSSGIRFGFFEGFNNSSPFKKVKYVSPGSYLKLSLHEKLIFDETKWYSLEEGVNKNLVESLNLSNAELIEKGKALFSESVRLRLQSDVPVAVSLSGGVDSSSIAALAKMNLENLTGFCYGSPNSASSEGVLVDRFIKEKNIDIVYIHPDYNSNELGDVLDRVSEAQEAPFCGLNIIAQHEVYREVKKHGFKVLLGGQGGDEIFAGYRKFFLIALKNSWTNKNYNDFISFFYSFGVLLLQGLGDYKIYWLQRNRFLKKTGKDLSFLSGMPINKVDLLGTNSLKARQILDVEKYSIPSLLRYEDRNSMSFSIESRLPLMDFRLVEFAIALSDRLKIKKGHGKWALREIVRDNVPSFILDNHVKRGFDVTQNWVSNGIGERLRNNLLGNKDKVKDYVSDLKKLESALSDDRLSGNVNLLYEAMLLNFMINPLKKPVL